jgi:hypothetical protein
MYARFYAKLGEIMILAMFWQIHHPRSSSASASLGASANELRRKVSITLVHRLVLYTMFTCSALAHLLIF